MKNLLIVFIALLSYTGILHAQPSNDECSGAIPLLVNYDSDYHPVNLSLSTTSQFTGLTSIEEMVDQQFNFTGRDVWYSFNTGDHNRITTYHDIYTSCGVRVDGRDSQGSAILTQNENYIIAVREFSIADQTLPSSEGLYLTFYNAASNKDCESAIEISLPSVGQELIIDDTEFPSRFVSDYIYYTMTPTQTMVVKTNYPLTTACDGNEAPESSYYQSLFYSKLEMGQEYHLNYLPRNPLTIESFAVPSANGQCNTATPILIGDPQDHIPVLHDDTGTGPQQGNGSPVSYYAVVAPSSGSMVINKLYNTLSTFHLYEAGCGVPTEVASTSDYSGNTTAFVGLTGGSSYTLAIVSDRPLQFQADELSLASNDQCDQPLATATDGSITQINLDVEGSEAVQSTDIAFDDAGDDLWYLVTNSSPILTFTTAGDGAAIRYQIYTDITDCGTMTSFGNVITGSGDYDTPSSDFLLRAYSVNNTSISGTLRLRVPANISPLAVNDECSGATEIILGETYITSRMLNASISADAPCADEIVSRDLWYTYTPTESETVNFQSDGAQLYRGICGTLEAIDCDVDNQLVRLSAGETYFIRLSYVGGNVFTFSVNSSSIPVVGCADATELDPEDNSLRTPNQISFSVDYPTSSCNPSNRLAENIYTLPSSSDMRTLSLRGSGSFSLFTGSCGNYTEVDCQNGAAVFELQSNINYTLLAINSLGRRTIAYSFGGPLPPEDDCTGALPLLPTTSLQQINFDYEVLTINEQDCNNNPSASHWISFVAPSSGSIALSGYQLTGFSNTNSFALFSDCSSTEAIQCEVISEEFQILLDNLVANQTYYISTQYMGDLSYIALGEAPDNITCSTAESVTADDCATNITGQSYDTAEGVYYTFAMPSTGRASIIGLEADDYEIYTGTCGDLTPLTIYDNDYIIATPNTTVYLKVNAELLYSFCIQSLDAPNYFNLSSESATIIANSPIGTCNEYPIVINPVSVTNDFENDRSVSLWYAHIANSDKVNITISGLLSTYLYNPSIFASVGASGFSQSLSDNNTTFQNLTVGDTILINIRATIDRAENICDDQFPDCWYDGSSHPSCDEKRQCDEAFYEQSQLSLNLCIEDLLPPVVNDKCADAIQIQLSDENCNNQVAGTTDLAFDTKYNCTSGTRDLWYTYTTSDEVNHKLKIQNASIPMHVSVFYRNCAGIELACGVDSVLFTSVADSTYIIAVSPLTDDQNTNYDLCLQELIIEGESNNVGIDIDDPVQKLHVDGAIVLGSSNQPFPGTVRYTGQDFEGYTNRGWKSLTKTIVAPASTAVAVGDNLGNHRASQPLEMNNNQIKGLSEPLRSSDAVNKRYVDDRISDLEDDLGLNDIDEYDDTYGATNGADGDNLGNHLATQDVNASFYRVVNLNNPIEGRDAATKSYVDNVVRDLATIVGSEFNPAVDQNFSDLFNQFDSDTFGGGIAGGSAGGGFAGSTSGDNLGDHQATQNLSMNFNTINDLGDPLSPNHAANKTYVDNIAEALYDHVDATVDNLDTGGSSIENVQLVRANGQSAVLEIATSDVTHTTDLSSFISGWYYDNPSSQPAYTSALLNVGIGVEEPTQELEILGTTRFKSSTSNQRFADYEMVGADMILDVRENNQANQTIFHHKLSSFGVNSFDFNLVDHRLGINKTDPSASIHINKNNATDYLRIDKNNVTTTVIDRDGYIGVGIADPQKSIDVNGGVQISTNSTSSSPQLNLVENNGGFSRLNMTNTSGKDITLAADPDVITANSRLNFYIEDAGDVMAITGAKRVGINNSNPEADLHVVHSNGGDVNAGFRLENGADVDHDYWNMYVSSTNDELRLYANSTQVGEFNFVTGVYSTVSDGRMKSGIKPLHFNWNNFMALNAANYIFRHDPNQRQYLGLIAQEVNEVYPELVQYDAEEDTYRLDYSGTGVVAIKAIQELKRENETLLKSNEMLVNDSRQMRVEMDTMKAQIARLMEKLQLSDE